MSSKKYFIVLGTFAVLAALSAVALGRHHRPFQPAHHATLTPGARALDLPGGVPVEAA